MIRWNYMGFAYGFSDGTTFMDYCFETEEELEEFIKTHSDIKIDVEAWRMLSDEFKIKYSNRSGFEGFKNWKGDPLPINGVTVLIGDNKCLHAKIKKFRDGEDLITRHESLKVLSQDCRIGNVIAVRC